MSTSWGVLGEHASLSRIISSAKSFTASCRHRKSAEDMPEVIEPSFSSAGSSPPVGVVMFREELILRLLVLVDTSEPSIDSSEPVALIDSCLVSLRLERPTDSSKCPGLLESVVKDILLDDGVLVVELRSGGLVDERIVAESGGR
mmetsp:Transcript_18731/g.29228  ORF Transcript_18731/g.29228 Transcript_18731/m.29228 type:complete len:145 (+) Transcript_18731:650-1084(+)